MKKVYALILTIIIIALAGYYCYITVQKQTAAESTSDQPTKCAYRNINPNRCEPENFRQEKEYTILRNQLNEYIHKQQQRGELEKISVYFRDLRNGPVMSINAQDQYVPASLLKLPFMIMVYKKAELDPSILERQIRINGNVNVTDQAITPEKTAQQGGTYTIEELVDLLITQSDNVSWTVLNEYFAAQKQESDYIETLSDLGIVDPTQQLSNQFVTAQTYASIFRVLYNSSYLNPQMSDKALDLLSQSTFKEGIVAGVKDDIRVAHKFGERYDAGQQQLHDCGIVYYPQKPYIMCVMTQGKSIDTLEQIIKYVSKEVYKEVSSRN